MRSTQAGSGSPAHTAPSELASHRAHAQSMADLIDPVVESLEPFERSVVRLRYDVGQSMRRIAESTTSTTDDVTAALMRAYRVIADRLER